MAPTPHRRNALLLETPPRDLNTIAGPTSTMPWTTRGSYAECKTAELSQILKRRSLAYSGRKAQMCARLIENDIAHPFPFMESPAEIRNTIYKLVAASPLTSDDPRVKSVLKKRDKLWTSGQLYGSDLLHGSPEMMIVQPGLFAVCKQIRTEGLGLYYQHHEFACYLRYPKDRSNILGPLLEWLDTIGITGRTNIRHLRFRVDRCYIRREVMNEVHRKLLDEATVIWEAEVVHFYQSGPTELWAIGKAYKNENPKKLPIFETYGHQRFSTFEDRPYVEALRHSSLTFTPGMGWFGKENSFSAEEIDEDVQMEETAVAT